LIVKAPGFTDLIGWLSSAILLMTIGRQVYTQWKTRSTAGVSRWLFIGQFTASCGFALYSYLLDNWVFLSSNLALLAAALCGQGLYLHNKRRAHPGATNASASQSTPTQS
jgi:MtN3 and saliva related transmembrane protein